MTRFVSLDVPAGGSVPVNPDQVAYLKRAPGEAVVLVFGAVQGGLHELAVLGDLDSVLAALSGPKFDTRRVLGAVREGQVVLASNGVKLRKRRTPKRPAS